MTSARSFPPIPPWPFLSFLIEDMADEWVTKIMFHYRWDLEVDQQYSSRQIISDNTPGLRGTALAKAARAIRDRQVGRMPLVGCTPQNKPIIEQSFHTLLNILDSFVTRDEYLFGTRPALADFGLFGQLKTLASDHTPMLIMRNNVPSVYDWVRRLEDSSGIEESGTHWGKCAPLLRIYCAIAQPIICPFCAPTPQPLPMARPTSVWSWLVKPLNSPYSSIKLSATPD